MTLLKNLTILKNENGNRIEDSNRQVPPDIITYHTQGFEASKSCQGRAENLKASLEALYYYYENKCKNDLIEQHQLKQPSITKLKAKSTSLLLKEADKLKLEKEIAEIDKDINIKKQDRINVKRNPHDYGIEVDTKSSARFWIGLFLLLPLTLYIFIFYISTSYSGFFRNFDPSVDLFGGMFYPQALQEAYKDGLLELGFIVFIPFVFFGLGYLIHMFQEKKGILNYFKIAMLFAVTFVFDAILAYLIEGKLYDLNKVYGDPDFSIAYAFQSPGFWVIIFAGFVSYLIWGLVFDFIMKEHADRDKVKVFIAGINTEIENLHKNRTAVKLKADAVETVIDQLKVEISEQEDIIDGFILPARNYKNSSSKYLEGWQKCISAEIALGPDQTNDLLKQCREIYDLHLDENGLTSFQGQNIIYKKTS